MPSGLQLSGSSSRKATLANPADPLSLTSQLDSLTVNGRTFTSLFDAAARTVTQTSAEGRQTVTQLDTVGRVVEERTPGVAPVQYGYGPRGFLTTVVPLGFSSVTVASPAALTSTRRSVPSGARSCRYDVVLPSAVVRETEMLVSDSVRVSVLNPADGQVSRVRRPSES